MDASQFLLDTELLVARLPAFPLKKSQTALPATSPRQHGFTSWTVQPGRLDIAVFLEFSCLSHVPLTLFKNEARSARAVRCKAPQPVGLADRQTLGQGVT